MIAKFGLKGVGFIDSLYREAYKEGYFVEWNQTVQLLIASDLSESEEEIKRMLEFSISIGLFNSMIFEEYSILTSKGIQLQFNAAIVKRKQVVFYKQFLLITPELPNWSKTKIIISDRNENLKDSEIIQSKEEYSKEKKSTEEDSKGNYSEVMEGFIQDVK